MGGKNSKQNKDDIGSSDGGGADSSEELANSLPENIQKQMASAASVASSDNEAKFSSDNIRVRTFRDKAPVRGQRRANLANTLKGTVRQRRGRIRQGLDNEPILKELIQLPKGEDLNDWLAVNTIHFFNIASMVYGTCLEFCSEQNCPKMSAGAKFEYLWADGVKVKHPMQVSARKYMDFLFDWIEEQISDPAIFPVEDDAPYPDNFEDVVKTIFKRIFRMYGHIYYSHFEKIRQSGAEVHLNSSFQHFAFFLCEFGLVDSDELRPLRKLLKKLVPGFE